MLAAGQGMPKGMEESFIVLGPSQQASAQHASPPPSQQQAQQHSGHTQHVDGAVFGLDAKLQALSQLFEMASTHTPVDHPLCMDCVGQLKDEMEAQVELLACTR